MNIRVTLYPNSPSQLTTEMPLSEIENIWIKDEEAGTSWRPKGWAMETVDSIKKGTRFIGHGGTVYERI